MILPRRLRVTSLLLVLLLTAGSLAAAAHRPQVWQPRLSVTGFLSEAWVLMSRVWEYAGSSTNPLGKEGGGIDPFGNPKPNTQPPSNSTSTESASGK